MRVKCTEIFRDVNNPTVDIAYKLIDLDTSISMVVEPMWVVSAVKDGIIQLEEAIIECGRVVITNYKDYNCGMDKSETGITMVKYRVNDTVHRTGLKDDTEFVLLTGLCPQEDMGSSIRVLETAVREVSEHPLINTAFSFHSRKSTHRFVDNMLIISYDLKVTLDSEPCVFHTEVILYKNSPEASVHCYIESKKGKHFESSRDCLVYTKEDLESIVFETVNELVLKVT